MRGRRSQRRSKGPAGGVWASLVLCGPAVVLYAAFIVLPTILGFAYSLTDWTGWTRTPSYIGIENFRELVSDERFRQAVQFTLFETVLIVLFFTFATMMLAIVLDKLRRFKGLIRGLFFFPYILSIIVSALLFQYLANYRHGAVNTLIRAVDLKRLLQNWIGHLATVSYLEGPVNTLLRVVDPENLAQDWMGDPALVPYFIFALVAWSGMGFFTTLYLANLQTIPTELYEAARIDGAGPWSVFSRIQFPMLIPTITTNSVLALITGINLFPQIVVTTQGGPGYRTFTIGYYIYHLGVLNNRQGYAAAVSFVTFVALVIVAAIQVAMLRRRQVAL